MLITAGCTASKLAEPLVVTRVERISIPAALLVCPDPAGPRKIRSQDDMLEIDAINRAALHACRANMEEIRKLNAAQP